jgi:membrane peptidoglycan carboxypeptidase
VFIRDQITFLGERVRIAVKKNEGWLCKGVSDSLIEMLVIAEDKRFWDHRGVDIAALFRAIYYVVVRRELQGASTTEQQLARTLTGYRRFSIKRKLREMALACVIGDFLNKREVAVLYLCSAYYGWRMNSLDEACRRMGVSAAIVGTREAAELVARLRYPEPHSTSGAWRTLMKNRASSILGKAARQNSVCEASRSQVLGEN